MSIKRLCLALCLCLSSTLVYAGIPKVDTWQTDNGVPVWFVQRPEVPIVDVRLAVAAGSVYDGDHPGLAAMVAMNLDAGTTSRSEQEIDKQAADVAAQLHVSVNRENSILSLRSLLKQPNLHQSVVLFNDVLTHASFPQKVVNRRQQQLLSSLKISANDTDYVAGKAFSQALYRGTAYAHPVDGVPDTIKQLTAAQCMGFYRQHYTASNMNMVIVGALSQQAAKQLANQIVAGLPVGQKQPFPVNLTALPKLHGQLIKKAVHSSQATILIGTRGIAAHSPKRIPLVVANELFGGPSLVSILFKEVRSRRGLVYGVNSSFSANRIPGPFVIGARTTNQQVQETVSVIYQVLEGFLEKGPTQSQLRTVKQALIGGFPISILTNASLANRLIWAAYYHYAPDYLAHYQQQVEAVTADQIREDMVSVVNLDKLITVVAGDPS